MRPWRKKLVVHTVESADDWDRKRGLEVVRRDCPGGHPREVYSEDDGVFFRYLGNGEWIAVQT